MDYNWWECQSLFFFPANSHYYSFALIFGNYIISPVPVMVLSRNGMENKQKLKLFVIAVYFY